MAWFVLAVIFQAALLYYLCGMSEKDDKNHTGCWISIIVAIIIVGLMTIFMLIFKH